MTLTHADLPGQGSDAAGGGSPEPPAPSGPRAAHAQRRVFSNAYKLRIVEEYDGLSEHGARGALLRREGLYQSHIEKWRKARDAGRLARSGRPAGGGSSGDRRPADGGGTAGRSENRRLQQENDRLAAELAKTRAVAEILGKAHALLEMISEGAEKPTS